MKQGLIFDVQRFSLHDGPGIRTVVFFKGCPLRCRWCQNPEGLRPFPEISFHAEWCVNARSCDSVCPRNAILLNGARRIRWEACDRCGLCAGACPSGALQMVGRNYGVDELLTEVLRDQAFYQASGGGITASGGEPAMQMEFLCAFLRRCKEDGLHTALETCGWVAWEALTDVLPFCDLVLYDVKAIDPALHRQLTGQDNARILENLRRLVASGVALIPRVPLIPTLTATAGNLKDIARFLRDLGLAVVHLLPYHRLGEAKLARLDSPLPSLWPHGHVPSQPTLRQAQGRLLSADQVDEMAGIFRATGLTVVIGGA
jgi:pyruvate formate lyase activating enzyme